MGKKKKKKSWLNKYIPKGDKKPMTTTYGTKFCHTGNVLITQVGKGGLYAGGWSRGAGYTDITIDLTGTEKAPTVPDKMTTTVKQSGVPLFDKLIEQQQAKLDADLDAKRKSIEAITWLTLPCKDYGIPTYDRDDFDVLVDILLPQMKKGKEVTVCCQGGHGRTGTVVAILAQLIRGKLGELQPDNPVTWLRKYYCDEVVETQGQEQYVYDILDLPITANKKDYEKPAVYTPPKSYPSYSGNIYKFCTSCNSTKLFDTYADTKCIDCKETKVVPLFPVVTADKCEACGGKGTDEGGLCPKCRAEFRALMDQAKKEGKSNTHYLFPGGKCIVCGGSPILWDEKTGNTKGDCYGVEVGKCGHIVHNQQYTRPDAACDRCHYLTWKKEDVDVESGKTT